MRNNVITAISICRLRSYDMGENRYGLGTEYQKMSETQINKWIHQERKIETATANNVNMKFSRQATDHRLSRLGGEGLGGSAKENAKLYVHFISINDIVQYGIYKKRWKGRRCLARSLWISVIHRKRCLILCAIYWRVPRGKILHSNRSKLSLTWLLNLVNVKMKIKTLLNILLNTNASCFEFGEN